MPGVDPAGRLAQRFQDRRRRRRSSALVGLLGQELGGEIEGWPAERVRAVLHSEHYFHAIHYPRAFHIHPLNYALGLAPRRSAPARASSSTRRRCRSIPPACASASPRRRRGCAPTMSCSRGNVHLGELMPRVAATLVPVYDLRDRPPRRSGRALPRRSTYRGAVSDTDLADNHYRIVDGDRLMWSGGATTWAARSAPLRACAEGGHREDLSAARRGRCRLFLVRHARQSRSTACRRSANSGPRMARERFRRPWAQHHRHGRQSHRARHRRGRRDLAAVHAVRAGLGGRDSGRAAAQAHYWCSSSECATRSPSAAPRRNRAAAAVGHGRTAGKRETAAAALAAACFSGRRAAP